MNTFMNNGLEMTKEMAKDLDKFLSTKNCNDINRQVYLILPLKDKDLKVTTCLIFNCHHEGFEEPVSIECEYTGCVIHLPAFWVEVPKELAFNYICKLINSIYTDTYTTWYKKGLIGDINQGNSNSGCGCHSPVANWTPV